MLEEADSVDAGFQTRNPTEPPFCCTDNFGETVLLVCCGRPLCKDAFHESLVDDGVF